MTLSRPLRRTLLSVAVFAALLGCGSEPAVSSPASAAKGSLAANPGRAPTEAELVAQLTSTLQACSYDGSPVSMDASRMSPDDDGGGGDVVAEIMKYTGLPPNFEVLAHPGVPNAAAVIVLGDDKLPRRVIAYNPRFIAKVLQATKQNDWAPVSIMAHEIAHHLSGHTIMPGGSQPPTELEADKFSGFVLFKMGALLDDAQLAMNALVPEQDGPTHPGRSRRVAAIAEGWRQACAQRGGECGTAVAAIGAPASATAAPRPAASGTSPSEVAVAAATPSTPASTAPTLASHRADVLPPPSADAIPSKFDRFVIDELGILDPATRAAHERAMFEHARDHGVEIVTLLVKNLHGMEPDAYAQAMMRQLRVGKLDVGNGAVLVVAADSGKVGVALGAGVGLELGQYVENEKGRLMNFVKFGLPNCDRGCGDGWTEALLGAAAHIADDTDSWEWTIRYHSAAEILGAAATERHRREASGDKYDPARDPTWRKLARVHGTLVQRDAGEGPLAKWVDARHAGSFGPALLLRTDDGREVLVYLDPATEALMTQPLVEGRRYAFVARERSLSHNPANPLLFDGLSYDAIK